MNLADKTGDVVVEFIEAAAIIRFNRPSSRNSISSDVLITLDSLLSHVKSRIEINAIVFTGTGDVFASGADIQELAGLDPESARRFSEQGQQLFQRIADTSHLTVAAINGYCMGGALDLALACDVRLASCNAEFAHPGALLGIITGWGGTQRLPRLIGKARALEMFLTARRFNAQEALEMGLVSGVEDPVLDCALRLARSAKKEVAGLSATPLVNSD